MQAPVYQDIPKYDLWLKAVLLGTPIASFVMGLAFLKTDAGAAYGMFAMTLFLALLFKAVMPARYLVYEDRIRIILGGPFSISIPFSRIKKVRAGSSGLTPTINLITSVRGTVQIDRIRAMSIVISPSRPDLFLEHLARYLGKDKIDYGPVSLRFPRPG